MSRYSFKPTAINDYQMYDKVLEKRGVNKILQYRTPKSKYVDQDIMDSIETTEYVWRYGDTYWKLASTFYGDPKLWWVIAAYNKKPTESHVNMGDIIKVPLSLADALQVVE